MYIGTAGGLGAYRRRRCGMGDATACTCINGTCVEDGNSCSSPVASPYQYTGSAAVYCDSSSALYNPTTCNNLYAAPAAQTFTQWLNANQTTVMYGAAAVLGLLLLSGVRR